MDYKIPQEVLDSAIILRRENPGRSVPSIMDQLEREEIVLPKFVRNPTLQDALAKARYSAATMRQYRQEAPLPSTKCRGYRNDLCGEPRLGQWGFYGVLDQETGYMVHEAFYHTVGHGAPWRMLCAQRCKPVAYPKGFATWTACSNRMDAESAPVHRNPPAPR